MNEQPDNGGKPLRVLLIAEGTYPFHFGGVSTWCHLLLSGLPQVTFTLMSLTGEPDMQPQFTLPANVVDFRVVSLWRVHDVLETRRDLGLVDMLRRKRATSDAIVTDDFIPIFRPFVHTLFGSRCEPDRLGQIIHQMYRFFLTHDFDATMRSQAVWQCFVGAAQELFPQMAASHGYPEAKFDLSDLITGLSWLYHWLFPLASPLPPVDVVHAAMVGISTMVAIATKLEYGAGYLLTEHGVYLRERYLAEAASSNSLFGKLFSLSFALRMTELSYAVADQISPCCDFNQRWERYIGADPGKLQTIYYGVDAARFAPAEHRPRATPTVVWVGRIDPLKDVLTLLKAAALVRQECPDIRFLLYGSAPPGNEDYYRQCLALRAQLDLEETVVFAGYTRDTAAAFNAGDVSVLSSVSEGFPYVILEAMLCEKPVVATAVGGVPEQIDGCGITVEPGNPAELARGILELVNDAGLRTTLGRTARAKAMKEYTSDQSHGAYYASYLRLASGGRLPRPRCGISGAAAADDQTVPIGVADCECRNDAPAQQRQGASCAACGAQMPSPGMTIATLVARVAERDPLPVDSLEVAAVIESLGVTDHVAAERYGVRDTFELAEALLARLRNAQQAARAALVAKVAGRQVRPIDQDEVVTLLDSFGVDDRVAAQRYGVRSVVELGELVWAQMKPSAPTSMRRRRLNARQTPNRALADYLRGPIAMTPSLFVVLMILMYAIVGRWTQTQVLALSLGMTGGILITNGFVHAIARRGSIYLSLDRLDAAWRFLVTFIVAGFLFAVAVAAITFAVVTRLAIMPPEPPFIFAVALGALSMLWLLGAGLSLVGQTEWLGIALAAGLLAGVGFNASLEPYIAAHLAIATIIGFVTIVTVLLGALWMAYGQEARRQPGRHRLTLPTAGFVVQEALPYFWYGLLYMLFVLVPHVLGWAGIIEREQERLSVITHFELGMTAALIPFMLVGGIAEHAIHLFWQVIGSALKTTPATDRQRFNHVLRHHYRWQLTIYLVALTAVSVVGYAVFQSCLDRGLLSSWLPSANADNVTFVFLVSLAAYWLLGWGVFNCVHLITLAQPVRAAWCVGIGIAVLVVGGVPLTLVYGFMAAPVAWVGAGLAFVVTSSWAATGLLHSADYYLAASL